MVTHPQSDHIQSCITYSIFKPWYLNQDLVEKRPPIFYHPFEISNSLTLTAGWYKRTNILSHGHPSTICPTVQLQSSLTFTTKFNSSNPLARPTALHNTRRINGPFVTDHSNIPSHGHPSKIWPHSKQLNSYDQLIQSPRPPALHRTRRIKRTVLSWRINFRSSS